MWAGVEKGRTDGDNGSRDKMLSAVSATAATLGPTKFAPTTAGNGRREDGDDVSIDDGLSNVRASGVGRSLRTEDVVGERDAGEYKSRRDGDA
jgi:hypothetical protein